MTAPLPGPKDLAETLGQLELKIRGLNDSYARRVHPEIDRIDTTAPVYEVWVWVRTHTVPFYFSTSIDSDLSPETAGMVPLSRTYSKINLDHYYLHGLPLEQVMRHENRHLDEAEPQLPIAQQEAKVHYLNADYWYFGGP